MISSSVLDAPVLDAINLDIDMISSIELLGDLTCENVMLVWGSPMCQWT